MILSIEKLSEGTHKSNCHRFGVKDYQCAFCHNRLHLAKTTGNKQFPAIRIDWETDKGKFFAFIEPEIKLVTFGVWPFRSLVPEYDFDSMESNAISLIQKTIRSKQDEN